MVYIILHLLYLNLKSSRSFCAVKSIRKLVHRGLCVFLFLQRLSAGRARRSAATGAVYQDAWSSDEDDDDQTD